MSRETWMVSGSISSRLRSVISGPGLQEAAA